MMKPVKRTLVLCVLLASVAGMIGAQEIEDSLAIGKERLLVEFRFGWQRVTQGDVEKNTYYNPTLFRYGLSENFELRLESDALTKCSRKCTGVDEESETGISPICVGAKLNFLQSEELNEVSLGMMFNVGLRSGTNEFESNDFAYAVTVMGDIALSERMSMSANFSWMNDVDFADERFNHFGGVLWLGLSLAENFALFAEIAADSAECLDGERMALFDIGATCTLIENLDLEVAYGRGISGEQTPEFFLTVGLIKLF